MGDPTEDRGWGGLRKNMEGDDGERRKKEIDGMRKEEMVSRALLCSGQPAAVNYGVFRPAEKTADFLASAPGGRGDGQIGRYGEGQGGKRLRRTRQDNGRIGRKEERWRRNKNGNITKGEIVTFDRRQASAGKCGVREFGPPNSLGSPVSFSVLPDFPGISRITSVATCQSLTSLSPNSPGYAGKSPAQRP